MALPIIDLHCDALLRMYEHGYDFRHADELDVNLPRLRTGHVRAQAFAIFVMPNWSAEKKLKSALHQVYYFQNHVVNKLENVVHIKEWSDFDYLQPNEIGVFLTIEGADFFEGDIKMWHLFKSFGVLAIGLAWNFPNEAADGLDSMLRRGVTAFGREIITLNNAHKILTDVTHLSEHSFWHCMEYADYVIATHSNAKAVCNHKRNLSDAQIRAMITKNAPIHIVYFPEFTTGTNEAKLCDLIKHVDHICALGGKHLIGVGSDFDGISHKITGLEHAGQHQQLINELLKHYSVADVRGFAYENFLKNRPR